MDEGCWLCFAAIEVEGVEWWGEWWKSAWMQVTRLEWFM